MASNSTWKKSDVLTVVNIALTCVLFFGQQSANEKLLRLESELGVEGRKEEVRFQEAREFVTDRFEESIMLREILYDALKDPDHNGKFHDWDVFKFYALRDRLKAHDSTMQISKNEAAKLGSKFDRTFGFVHYANVMVLESLDEVVTDMLVYQDSSSQESLATMIGFAIDANDSLLHRCQRIISLRSEMDE